MNVRFIDKDRHEKINRINIMRKIKIFNLSYFILVLVNCLLLFSTHAEDLASPPYLKMQKDYCQLKKALTPPDKITCLEGPHNQTADKEKLSFLQSGLALACENYYLENHCKEYKNSLKEKNRHLVISCSPKNFCNNDENLNIINCSIDGVKTQLTFSNLAIGAGISGVAAATGASALTTSLVALPLVIYSAGKDAENCNRDLAYKSTAIKMHNLSLLETEKPLDIENKDKAVLNMQCTDLNAFLKNRLEVFISRRIEQNSWSLNPATRPQPRAARLLLDLLHNNRCLNQKVVKEEMCNSIAATLTAVAIGGVSNTAGRESAALIANTFRKPIYKTVPVKESYVGENKGKVFATKVEYFTKAESDKLKISVNPEGKLIDADGKFLNCWEKMYVMDDSGQIYLYTGKAILGKTHHSSILGGRPVAGAGVMSIKDGEIYYIDRSSGHYRPSSEIFKQVIEQLKKQGAIIRAGAMRARSR